MCPDVSKWVREVFADLTDVTLADQATHSIHADNANMAIQGNVAMQVTHIVNNFRTNQVQASGDPIVNWCILRCLVDKFVTDATEWPNFVIKF